MFTRSRGGWDGLERVFVVVFSLEVLVYSGVASVLKVCGFVCSGVEFVRVVLCFRVGRVLDTF